LRRPALTGLRSARQPTHESSPWFLQNNGFPLPHREPGLAVAPGEAHGRHGSAAQSLPASIRPSAAGGPGLPKPRKAFAPNHPGSSPTRKNASSTISSSIAYTNTNLRRRAAITNDWRKSGGFPYAAISWRRLRLPSRARIVQSGLRAGLSLSDLTRAPFPGRACAPRSVAFERNGFHADL